ncbi:carboxypeptidase regulatory-like domain-containing protein [Microcoleus sp. D3_18a_C4]|uniref:carboxypeptidase regulatory-like domain-containing protein n=1 Tax=Microcoleus sp. D3_18a_C4 TaxID=3055332 RepID=UPI002FCEA27B
MLKRERSRYKISIVGQVKDAIANRGIPDAIVKIVDAPDEFIKSAIFKAKLLGLPGLQIHWRSLIGELNPANKTLPQEFQDFQQSLKNPNSNSADKLKLFQSFLEEPKLSDRQKFQGLQEILDYLPFSPKHKISQPERTQTAADGWFYFRDLPPGIYQLQAFLPNAIGRYSAAQGQIEIGQKDGENIDNPDPNVSLFDKIRVELKLKPTTLLGKVTNYDDEEAIGMAKVQIQGKRDYTFSASELTKQQQGEWNYRLVGIEAGNTPLTVIVSARGHPTQQKEISLQTGEVKSLDFQLVPARSLLNP